MGQNRRGAGEGGGNKRCKRVRQQIESHYFPDSQHWRTHSEAAHLAWRGVKNLAERHHPGGSR